MRKFICTFILASTSWFSLSAEVYVLEGVYQGKDVYVQNPFSSEGVGFCIFEVTVNGEITSDEINSSAFAVDLAMYEFNMGDEVIITIKSKSDCEPNVINPDAISPKSSCQVSSAALDANNTLTWNTTDENGKLPFIVEQFKWNKWVQVGSVLGKGSDFNSYQLKLHLPAGRNKLRIKQKDYSGDRIASELTVEISIPEVELISDKIKESISFTGKTHYELFNEYGVLVKSGLSAEIDTSDLEKGYYYLNYEKTLGTVLRKK
ncbi:MAG: hypothetical protein AB8B53_02390 [Flavobacteriales bacterium]